MVDVASVVVLAGLFLAFLLLLIALRPTARTMQQRRERERLAAAALGSSAASRLTMTPEWTVHETPPSASAAGAPAHATYRVASDELIL